MAVVTISKEYASGSGIFARQLAEQLNYTVLEKELLGEAAKKLQELQSKAAHFAPERESRLFHLMHKFPVSTLHKAIDRSFRQINSKSYYEVTEQLVEKAAQDDNVVILGWGGQCILKKHVRAVHLRIVRKLEERIAALKVRLGLDDQGARDLILREERDSASYIRYSFNEAWDDPHLYHMTLNLSYMATEEAVQLVSDWMRKRRVV